MAGDLVSDPLAERYGRRTTRRRPALIVTVAVLAAAGLAWVLWAAIVHSNPPVSSQLRSFRIESPTSVTATIVVDRSKNTQASCRLRAQASDFAIVGERTVTVPADAPRRQVLTVTITTQREATAAVLIGCTTADSRRPG